MDGTGYVGAALAVQQGLTALASAFNAHHFLSHPYRGRRRLGALVLALVNLAFLAQALFLGLLPLLAPGPVPGLRGRLAVGVLPLAASALIALLVLRRR